MNCDTPDFILFLELIRKTEDTLELWSEIDDDQEIVPDHLKNRLKDILDVPYINTVLLTALEDVDYSLKLAEEISRDASLGAMVKRIRSISDKRTVMAEHCLDQFDPKRAGT